MFCSNCGEKNDINNKYCFSCGNKLNSITDKKTGNKETSLILGIICIISSVFLNVICFIPGIISIVYAKKYKKESGKLGVGFGLSIGGMLLSLVLLILFILFFILIFNSTIDIINNYDFSNLPHV